MDREGFGCETLKRENHGADSGCGKIRGEFGIRVCRGEARKKKRNSSPFWGRFFLILM